MTIPDEAIDAVALGMSRIIWRPRTDAIVAGIEGYRQWQQEAGLIEIPRDVLRSLFHSDGLLSGQTEAEAIAYADMMSASYGEAT